MVKGPVLTTVTLPWAYYYGSSSDPVWDMADPFTVEIIGVSCVGFDWTYISRITGLRGAWICQDPR